MAAHVQGAVLEFGDVLSLGGVLVNQDDQSPSASPATGAEQRYRLVAVRHDVANPGTFEPVHEFADAEILPYSKTLNGIGNAQAFVPVFEGTTHLPLANAGVTPTVEVQIWRHGKLDWWGIPVRRRLDFGKMAWRYTFREAHWPISRRFVGDAERTQLFANGGFESGVLAPWVASAGISTATVAQEPTNRVLTGDWSVALSAATAPENPAYIENAAVVQGGAIGLAVFYKAWFYLDVFNAPAAFDAAMTIERLSTTGEILPSGEGAAVGINANTPLKTWTGVEVFTIVPKDTTEFVRIRLWSPANGTIFWDAGQGVIMDSVSFVPANHGGTEWDQVEMFHELVRYSQGRGTFAASLGSSKSDLHIGVVGALSGITFQKTYFEAQHQRLYTARPKGRGVLDEFPQRRNGLDFALEITPTTRRMRTYFPSKGTARDAFPIEYGRSLSDRSSYEESIIDSANEVVVIGPSSSRLSENSTREEGGYSNPAALGGLTLEHHERAPTDADIELLDDLAASRGAELEDPAFSTKITVSDVIDPDTGEVQVDYVGTLETGDVVPLRIYADGVWIASEDVRIIERVVNPKTETVDLGVNADITA